MHRFDNYTSTVVVDNITVSLGLWDTVSFNLNTLIPNIVSFLLLKYFFINKK